jgi:polyferredoxin
MPSSPIVQLLLALVVAGCAFGLWKGGPPERYGAAAILLNSALTLVGGNLLSSDYSYIFGLVLDGATAVGFLGMTLIFGRLWLGAAMLVYAAQFALRSYYLVADRKPDLLHAMINNANFMAIILCIVIGTAVAWRRRVRGRKTA